ncbi:hypothetical protein A2765_00415 [Candidatus Kaiserbacteria bacterium RIFCSPHIGHO2_01_FULL_56_24]|uniref:NodB homology domain-containing protein n=1 Tax=Candidatus Kaiserbacteria bacterium RIFCSPHIGHO2_01_FULL_56_24 TaxID=1798487 RepID=A0A1F6DBW4_9BACT|nr:MAG: hypothetical protein A2765_00415 [Candidatus Kaiserbacteria bacterium RIFCSPHIGHO2_01_FULL_56_24]
MVRALKTFLKDLFFIANRRPLGARASILSYHNIGTDRAFFTVHPAVLEKQLRYLQEKKYTVVFLSELIRRLRAGGNVEGCIALTFNDGFESVHADVLPLLRKYAMPASVFTTVEYLDTNIQTSDGFTFKTLSVSSVRELIASGLVEFFPQTQHRQPLDGVAFEQAAARVEQARKDLESVIKRSASVFAYPKGRYTHKLVEYLRTNAWDGAVTTAEGLVSGQTDPFLLPRNSIDSRTTFTQFKGKVEGTIDAYVARRAK